MESAGLRSRERNGNHAIPLPARVDTKKPPKYTIDLSQPPLERYTHVAADFRSHIETLPSLFDDIVHAMAPPFIARRVRQLARLALRRVYSKEETQELRGISAASGVDMYLLVSLNVLLDLFLGCTSGGVRIEDESGGSDDSGGRDKTRMLHFRTLDWGMDPLRKIVVELDFVRTAGGPVVATSMTYFGFVGVLTGVRQGLSMSLNFRPHHDTSTVYKRLGFRWHQILVLLGFRQSIASTLRQCLLPAPASSQKEDGGEDITTSPPSMETLLKDIVPAKSTAAYIIFCTGDETISVEKDNGSALVRRAPDFLVVLNHDERDEQEPQELEKAAQQQRAGDGDDTEDVTGMASLVEYSLERKRCVKKLWEYAQSYRRSKRRGDEGLTPSMVRRKDVVRWMEGHSVCNDETHYAVIMDPTDGSLVWRRRWLEPIDPADVQ